jgi:hypothetical protein
MFDIPTFENFMEKLHAMTVNEIHDYCIRNNVKAMRRNTSTCVIAELLNTTFDSPEKKFRVGGGGSVRVYENLSYGGVDVTINPLATVPDQPDGLREFIYRFDAGEYPELETRESLTKNFKAEDDSVVLLMKGLPTSANLATQSCFDVSESVKWVKKNSTCVPMTGIQFTQEDTK